MAKKANPFAKKGAVPPFGGGGARPNPFAKKAAAPPPTGPMGAPPFKKGGKVKTGSKKKK